ncbi:HIG1 domain family member 1A, mitochondrial-like [Lasioglossum baleicum]|uniref:HIG1 domain family member 1A, mitochondrial-like n=1 Tax=Lasioglossum baleicum TaxID=434251 RepID=UPI003FCE743D
MPYLKSIHVVLEYAAERIGSKHKQTMSVPNWRTAKEIEIPEEALRQTLENEDRSSITDKLYNVVHRQPFLAAGLIGFTIVTGIGIYKWRTKSLPASMFIVQLRVAAQGTVIGCLTLGMIQQMYNTYTKMNEKNRNP